ncbi:MAG: hypothetical protein LUE90_06695 [Clostridiales bacterium]|nr:hypothetical protein [Clostridiales bacterium]
MGQSGHPIRKIIRNNKMPVVLICLGVAAVILIAGLYFAGKHRLTVADVRYAYRGEVTESGDETWTMTYSQTARATTLRKQSGAVLCDMTDDGILLYQAEDGSVILPNRYVLQYANDREGTYRVELFATVTAAEDGVLIEDGYRSTEVSGGVLYNGRDTYLFLEDVTLTVDGEEYDLPKLTGVRALYGDGIDICTPDGDAVFLETDTTSVATTELSAGCVIYLLSDRAELSGGGSELMNSPSFSWQRISGQ